LRLLAFLASYCLDLVVVIAIAAATWLLSNFISQRRTNILMAIAHQLGFAFEGDDWGVGSRAPQLETPLFERGRDKIFRNIMTGSRAGVDSNFFDYSFGRGRHSTQQTLATFTQDSWLPLFEIAPKNILGKLGNTILRKDIRIGSHPGFSTQFHVRSSEEEKIRAMLTSELLTYLEGLDPKMKWHIEGCGHSLVIYRLGKMVKPENFAAFVEETTAIAKAFYTFSGLKILRT
jgi:hypothetical protein